MKTNIEILTIGKVSQRSGIGVETVRYYERRGLIEPPSRSPSGYRLYSEDVLSRLLFIRRAKELGFTLKEIGELLSLRLEPTTTCSEVRQRAEIKIENIESKIKLLSRMKKALVRMVQQCSNDGLASECPILQSLDQTEEI